jgi:hypothetical protein
MTRHRVITTVGTTILVALATPAVAEVMDKEPTLAEIWSPIPIWAVLALAAARVHPFLGLGALVVYAVLGGMPVLALAEVHDPLVGPAIRAEAGMGYVWQVYGANATVVLACLAGVGIGKLLQQRRRSEPPQPDTRCT